MKLPGQTSLSNPSEVVVDLENLKERKRAVLQVLVGDAALAANDFSDHRHCLYCLNIRYHRMSLIKHSVQLYSMDTLVKAGSIGIFKIVI
jgi:hypothetical protein